MRSKTSIFAAALCALALGAAGCGDDEEDNQALSYEDTGAEIGKICDSVSDADAGLNGKAKNDASKLGGLTEKFGAAIEKVRDLEVNEELAADRDEFVDNAEQSLAVFEDAETIAKSGDQKAYEKQLKKAQPLDKESDEIASRLGATACLDDE